MMNQGLPKSINVDGQLIFFDVPKIMGILNLTPDSFYDGGRYQDESAILNQVDKMLSEGADFIDVGAYSSRPNNIDVSLEKEKNIILPIIELISKKFPNAILSVDTFRSEVAKSTLEAGAHIINDISAGTLDNQMIPLIASKRVPYIIMHMRGNPQTMMAFTNYKDVAKEVISFLSERIELARNHGISDLIIDPGFGFSKTLEQNYELFTKLGVLDTIVGLPLLVGVSRKSMIFKPLNLSPEKALNGTSALHMASLIYGANILRVHDVKEGLEVVKLFLELKKHD